MTRQEWQKKFPSIERGIFYTAIEVDLTQMFADWQEEVDKLNEIFQSMKQHTAELIIENEALKAENMALKEQLYPLSERYLYE
jgi:FtsZ-binding cell division protein ZapB